MTTMARRLEKHPIFPYVAWGAIIGFTLFVIYFTVAAAERIEQLETDRSEQRTNWGTADI